MSTLKPKRLRRRKPGDLGQLRAVLWGVLLEVEGIAQAPTADPDRKLKAASVLATLAGSYAKATEAHDLEQRLQALEVALQREPAPLKRLKL
ncbi:hypothetical protein FCL43_022605 [Enterobacter hormaechei]|uniref:Uncharacterized protein n=2 Tax=Bacteria TaxID=2 RepID=A0A3S0HAX8_STEMA|nr:MULTISPECIES: hypothetical protein [Bacteria]MWR20420.1 hypothetical protein [Helicobacter pylori]RAR28021.1 hypothetical protein DP092_25825 [Pseudomonas sp. MDMC224]RAR38901.1 hypothetical protein DP091_30775 [Paenibacillus sp. MDMC362]SIP65831.1 conserved hypothetical protein [Mycobacterium tuberculosis]MDI6424256.1 hypothetical protein [Enterobacter hormaechei]